MFLVVDTGIKIKDTYYVNNIFEVHTVEIIAISFILACIIYALMYKLVRDKPLKIQTIAATIVIIYSILSVYVLKYMIGIN